MEKAKAKTVFICQKCGNKSLKWLGRCPVCQEWNSFEETLVSASRHSESSIDAAGTPPQELSRLKVEAVDRIVFPISEFNRVLGGGLVPGSMVLIGGDPGIGKSTLLLQASATLAGDKRTVLYVSGEESFQQIKLRAKRLSIAGDSLFLLPETNLDIILRRVEDMVPMLVIIDSIQTMYVEDLNGVPGSVNQIRECTLRLMRLAKRSGIPILISGHVTKEGDLAGPKALEHIVDVVLSLEGETFGVYRILRSTKNRFGSTNEVGVFEMTSDGLNEVTNPSEIFLASHSTETIGSAVVATFEGSRPILVEVQALTTFAHYGPPRRIANGIDMGRLLMIAAVLTRRARINLSNQDIIANVVGGLKVSEPVADLGVALAIASSFKDSKVAHDIIALGEIGLSGELRHVPQLERRLSEAARLGFKRCIVPASSHVVKQRSEGIQILKARSVAEAIQMGLTAPQQDGKADD